MEYHFFANQFNFRAWLNLYHKTAKELWVGYYKVGSSKTGMTYSQSVDEALCFGWIDGIRKSIDSESYCNRFTPRRTSSIWSAVNIAKVEELTRKGLMQPAGIDIFNKRKVERSGIYSFENQVLQLPLEFEEKLKSNNLAYEFYINQAPSYKRTAVHWILSAKKTETQYARLTKLIVSCAGQMRLF